jgi:aspartyl-tRNA(Asn)/glutamyl-tRNA(Gln) amidotransferase subunit A
VVPISLPLTKSALPVYYILTVAEASSNLQRYDGMQFGERATYSAAAVEQAALGQMTSPTSAVSNQMTASRDQLLGPEVVRRIVAGSFVLSRSTYESYYAQAQRVRRLICHEFEEAFTGGAGLDVILTPTAPTGAPTVAEAAALTPLETYANDVFTVPASLAGLPALSVPAGTDGAGLPLGLQIVGRRFDERAVLRVGQALEDTRS